MRKILYLFLAVLSGTGNSPLAAQNIEGAQWTFTIDRTSPAEATLVFNATVKETFHIYSQFLSTNEGPIPTSFEFTPDKTFELIGKVEEEKGHEIFDEAFQLKLLTFEGKTTFRQKIKILSSEPFTVTGKLVYMACDNRMCLPPAEVPFAFSVLSK